MMAGVVVGKRMPRSSDLFLDNCRLAPAPRERNSRPRTLHLTVASVGPYPARFADLLIRLRAWRPCPSLPTAKEIRDARCVVHPEPDNAACLSGFLLPRKC